VRLTSNITSRSQAKQKTRIGNYSNPKKLHAEPRLPCIAFSKRVALTFKPCPLSDKSNSNVCSAEQRNTIKWKQRHDLTPLLPLMHLLKKGFKGMGGRGQGFLTPRE